MRRALLVVVAASVGCGDNRAGDVVGERSGERLRIVYFEYDGGTRQRHDALYDADRDERCTPQRWSDGLTYCTPDAAPALYVDRDCTTEVAPAGSPYALHQFWLTDRLFPSRLHALGAPAAAPSEMYLARGGACLGPFAAPPGDYVALGDAIAQDELARVHVGEPVGAGRIGLIVLTGDDGLQLPARLYDRELDLECADDGTHCAPREAASADYFHDETCTTPELSLSIAAPPPTLAVHRDRDTACAAYHRVAGQTGSNPLYRRIAERCDLAEAPSGEHQFLLGEPLALAPLRRTTAATAARMHAIAVATGDIALAAPELFDATLGATCTTRDRRCMPVVTAPVLDVFADEICATGARVAEVAERACDPPTAFASDGTTLYPLVGASAPVYQLTTGDRCAPYLPPAGHALHALGPALALDQLAAAREVITSPSSQP
jgi:hypothetical protein